MIPSLTKSIRSGAPIEAFYPGFREDPKFCPMLALKIYEKKNHLGKVLNHGTYYLPPLGIEAIKSVKPATIGHWLKNLIKEAGIDTSLYTACSILHTPYCTLYTAYSIQRAATYLEKAVGVPMTEILKAANWSSASTFCRFYNRPSATN